MAIIAGVTMIWGVSPRIAVIPIAETSLLIDDLRDTLRNIEDIEDGVVHPPLMDISGGQTLGGGDSVGWTLELWDTQVYFSARSTALVMGLTCDTADTSGRSFEYVGADFSSVVRGDTIFNITTGSMATIITVDDINDIITSLPLTGSPVRNTWEVGDTATIYQNISIPIQGGNLVAIDSVGGELEPVLQSPNVQVVKTSSSSATLRQLDDIEYSSFGGYIHIDVDSSYSGTAHPIGTERKKVNNLIDALIIADDNGIGKLKLHSNLTIEFLESVEDFLVEGLGRSNTTLTLIDGSLTTRATMESLTITGVCGGRMNINNSRLRGISGLCASGGNANISNTVLEGNIGFRDFADQNFNFTQCIGSVANVPTIDINGSPAGIHFTHFAGEIIFANATHVDGFHHFEMSSGKVEYLSSCTNGEAELSGVGRPLDNSNGMEVNLEGLLLPEMAFGGSINIDTINGVDGTSLPFGTPFKAVKTIQAAEALRVKYNMPQKFSVRTSPVAPLFLDKDYINYSFEGQGSLFQNIIVVTGQNITGSIFERFVLTGTFHPDSDSMQFNESSLLNVINAAGLIYNGGTDGTIVVSPGKALVGKGVSGLGSPTVIDFNGSATASSMFQVENGLFQYSNMVSGTTIFFTGTSGQITFDPTCVDGLAVCSGCVDVQNLGAVTVLNDSVINNDTITDSVMGYSGP